MKRKKNYEYKICEPIPAEDLKKLWSWFIENELNDPSGNKYLLMKASENLAKVYGMFSPDTIINNNIGINNYANNSDKEIDNILIQKRRDLFLEEKAL